MLLFTNVKTLTFLNRRSRGRSVMLGNKRQDQVLVSTYHAHLQQTQSSVTYTTTFEKQHAEDDKNTVFKQAENTVLK